MTRTARPRLRFLGAAGTVTGSRYLIEARGRRILVDCGLFQGFKRLRARNRKPFPVRPNTIDTVLLTHAHLDHSGYLPALIRAGGKGLSNISRAGTPTISNDVTTKSVSGIRTFDDGRQLRKTDPGLNTCSANTAGADTNFDYIGSAQYQFLSHLTGNHIPRNDDNLWTGIPQLFNKI